MSSQLNPQHKLVIKLLLSILPVWHVYRNEIVKILVMIRVKKVGQLVQNDIFYARNACFVQIEVQINFLILPAATTP